MTYHNSDTSGRPGFAPRLFSISFSYENIGYEGIFFFLKLYTHKSKFMALRLFWRKVLDIPSLRDDPSFFALELKAFIFISFPTGENHPFSWRNTTVGWQSPRTKTSGCLFSVKWLRVWKV